MKKTIHSTEYLTLISILKEERIKSGLTQIELAKKIEEDQTFISKIETCERRLDIIELREICIAIGVSLPQLLNEFEEKINNGRF